MRHNPSRLQPVGLRPLSVTDRAHFPYLFIYFFFFFYREDKRLEGYPSHECAYTIGRVSVTDCDGYVTGVLFSRPSVDELNIRPVQAL